MGRLFTIEAPSTYIGVYTGDGGNAIMVNNSGNVFNNLLTQYTPDEVMEGSTHLASYTSWVDMYQLPFNVGHIWASVGIWQGVAAEPTPIGVFTVTQIDDRTMSYAGVTATIASNVTTRFRSIKYGDVLSGASSWYIAPNNLGNRHISIRWFKVKAICANGTAYGVGFIKSEYNSDGTEKYYTCYPSNILAIADFRIPVVYGEGAHLDTSFWDSDGDGGDLPEADEELTDETSSSGGYGGEGAHDHTSDLVGVPNEPAEGVTGVGLLNLYKISRGTLNNLGNYLFPTLDFSGLNEILSSLVNVFAFQDAIQYVVDCHIIPVAPTVGGSNYITLGRVATDISAPMISSDYVDFNCGAVSIPENFANYIDYIGTRAKLFLPFVGFVDIKPEYFNGGTLGVKYRFNVVDGSFMAFVTSTSSKSQLAGSVIGQYGGNACIHIPVVASSYGAIVGGLVQGSMSLAQSAAGGDIEGAASSALTMLMNKPPMQQSNNYNGSTSFLGIRRPYLIIERAVPSFAAYYNKDKGLPLNVTAPLAQATGLTVVNEIDFTGETFATSEDLQEIRELLREGVRL